MRRPVYYNENNRRKAAWLRWLIAEGLLPDGEIDDRSIADIQPGDLAGFGQKHFFAGCGGWPLAFLIAGVPAGLDLWSGSCPCQPFSSAGRREGRDDPRHLWPHLFRLIDACRPAGVVGEQVAGALGYGWFDGVAADLGRANYASWTIDIPAAAVDSPQIRQRLWWFALDLADGGGGGDPGSARRLHDYGTPRPDPDGPDVAWGALDLAGADGGGWPAKLGREAVASRDEPQIGLSGRDDDRGAVARGPGKRRKRGPHLEERRSEGRTAAAGDDAGEQPGVAQGDTEGRERGPGLRERGSERDRPEPSDADGAGAAQGRAESRRLAIRELTGWSELVAPWWFDAAGADGRNPGSNLAGGSWWAGADWFLCHDDKQRRVADAGAPLLAARFPGRVVAWSGMGDAICVPLAVEVLKAALETIL